MTSKQQNRTLLQILSNKLAKFVENGDFETMNNAIIAHYKAQNQAITEFKTFHDWKKQGFAVRKGEKAFLVWGKPLKKKETEKPQDVPTDAMTLNDLTDNKYFPICYLFSNLQVEKFKSK